MSDERWRRLRDLFAAVQEMSDAERAAFLDRELASDPGLRAEIDALLAHASSAGSFLAPLGDDETRAVGAAPPTGASLAPGSAIGPYRVVHLLGEGGFGVVYLADQERPIRRRVALKLIKPGMDTRHVIARFEAERQTLALMDHPAIAQVFDAGETDAGRPYFAMEYVPGVPITAFCDEERLRVRERLALFLEVCDAIQHAHQKGVIHRDIKPSNVLVARREGSATLTALKVIDFGIVKATSAGEGDRSFVTREGMVLGTLGYMSPEQAGAIEATVDTRSDIYSLGVLLYELLAGETPFDPSRLRRAAWTEAVRIIREEEPPSLTARLARHERVSEIARVRSTDERALSRELNGELEWITLRALEKEPDRRYASASELAADVRRYLANEAVLARAPSTIYRVRKFARRHRVGVAAGALVLVSIVAGGIAAGVGFTRAVRAERSARREAESARQVSDFLVELFRTSTPDRSRGETITARTLLDDGTRRIKASAIQDPHVRARLLTTLGQAHMNLGLFDDGLSLLRDALATSETALPRDGLEIAGQLRALASGLRLAGKAEEDISALLDRALALVDSAGSAPPAVEASILGEKGAWLSQKAEYAAADSLIALAIALSESEARPDTMRLVRLFSSRANIAHVRFELSVAESLYRRALVLTEANGTEPSRACILHGRLAMLYGNLHKTEEAMLHAQEGLRIARQIYRPNHPNLSNALDGLARALTSAGKYEEAIALREEAVDSLRANAGSDDQIAGDLNSLGILYRALGRFDLAIARNEEALARYRRFYGAESFRVGEALANIAGCCADAGQTERADSLYRIAIPLLGRFDQRGLFTAIATTGHGNLCRDAGRFAEADTLYARVEAMLDTSKAGMRPFWGECVVNRGYLRSLQGSHAQAESMMQAGVAVMLRELAPDSRELRGHYALLASARARAADEAGAMEAIRLALRSGVTADDLDRYAELAPLRNRTDFPEALRK
jgi:tetratricopeptide (TPR) repeat protein/tRNA A-37 threonylcarbamoyl transferase component Bud32